MDLSSKRLTYVKCKIEGIEDYLNFGMNEAVMHYVTFSALSREKSVKRYEAAVAVNNRNTPFGYWMAYTKDTGELIIYLKIVDLGNGQHEVGYLVLPEHWGKGYASEVTATLVDYAKTIDGVTELIGIVDSRNNASKRVLLKQGFKYYKSEEEEHSVGEYFGLRV